MTEGGAMLLRLAELCGGPVVFAGRIVCRWSLVAYVFVACFMSVAALLLYNSELSPLLP